MDPTTLATAALAILAPFVKDAGKELVKTAGEIGFEKAKELFGWLKQRFSGNPVAASDLSRFEADPEVFRRGLERTIKEQAEKDPVFAAELKKRIDEIGPMLTVFQEMQKGKDVVGLDADEVRSGQVAVTQKIAEAEKVVGAQVKKIG